jgi:hypothetical protein
MSRVFRYDILEEVIIPNSPAFLRGEMVTVNLPASYNLRVDQLVNCVAHNGKKLEKYAAQVTSVMSVPGDDTVVEVSLKKP